MNSYYSPGVPRTHSPFFRAGKIVENFAPPIPEKVNEPSLNKTESRKYDNSTYSINRPVAFAIRFSSHHIRPHLFRAFASSARKATNSNAHAYSNRNAFTDANAYTATLANPHADGNTARRWQYEPRQRRAEEHYDGHRRYRYWL